MPATINTLKYGTIPTAKSSEYLHDEIIDTVECCDGSFYEIRKSFTGAVVALINND